MSLAVLEGMRKDTLYVGTAGGMGPRTIAALERELMALAERPGAVMIAATDADAAGDKYAAHLAELAAAANVPAQRAVPAEHKDLCGRPPGSTRILLFCGLHDGRGGRSCR
jgi:hypothetical protein